jgi:NADH-quinone oxidoreductase subunit M
MHSALWPNLLILVPLLGAALTFVVRRREGAAYIVGLATTAVETILAIVTVVLYNANITGASGYDFVTRAVVSAPLGLAWDVGIDGLSLFLVLLTSFTTFLALAGARDRRREATYVGWLLALTAFVQGSFVSHDLLLFFLFFEATLVPSYFLISQWGGAERSRAAMKFFVYTFTGSAPLFAGLLYLGFAYAHQTGGALSFSYGSLSTTVLSTSTAIWLFVAFAIAFAVKSPIWPFHTWSPLTYAESPTAAVIVFSALMAKMGGYGLLRFAVGLFPQALPHVQGVVSTLAVIGILWGSLLACATKDLKRVIAYSSLAQMGFVTLGIVSGSVIGTEGAVLLMFNHGVIAIGLFLLVGYIEQRRGSYQIADLSGLQGPAPVLAALFTVVMLASIGLPGLSGFVSEFLVLLGTYTTHAPYALVAALGVVGAAAYLLWAYQRVFHGEATGANAAISDLSTRERLVMVPVVGLLLFLGVYPRPFLQLIEPSVRVLITHVAAGVL